MSLTKNPKYDSFRTSTKVEENMMKQPFAIIHNLDGLDKVSIAKYLADMSAYIGLDPALNGLDTIYMNDPQGGRALVPYARRGTCEILRNLYEVQVESLTYATVSGSIVFTATGISAKRGSRQEIAIGSKYIEGLKEKLLDNAIMTASTRALQRLTMQFTELGILAESEVVDLVGQTPNPAGSAQLASNPLPPAFLPPPSVPANNAPGKPVETAPEPKAPLAPPVSLDAPFVGQQDQIDAAIKQLVDKEADRKAAQPEVKPVESITSSEPETDKKAVKKPRKKANTVALDVEAEVVQSAKPAVPTQANLAVPPQAYSVAQNPPSEGVSLQVPAPEPAVKQMASLPPVEMAPVVGMPSKEQMDEYRKKISVYTVQLPPSQDLGPTQKMRAFITKVSGTAPQSMTVEQWDEVIAFIDGFMERNQGNVKNLITYINDLLGVK